MKRRRAQTDVNVNVVESYLEGEWRGLGVEAGEGGARRVALEQAGAQPLCVALGDEAALVRGHGEDPRVLQGHELAGGAGRAVDLQLLARAADLLPVELGKSLAEDLGQAESELAANAVIGL